MGGLSVLGFGNRMWSDDGAGSIVAEELAGSGSVHAVDGGMVPENHLEQVARGRPDTVLLIDAVDFGGAPGDVRLLRPGDAALGGISTHAGSPQMLARYFEVRTGARVGLVAIQPADLSEGGNVSSHVATAIEYLVDTLGRGEWERI